jgi:hypothetical protein
MEKTIMTSLYLIPQGKNGFFYEPEIEEVVNKYATLKLDITDPDIAGSLVKDIGERIRQIPFETVAIDDVPVRHLEKLEEDVHAVEEGLSLKTTRPGASS